jgi:chromosome segregation ATPase
METNTSSTIIPTLSEIQFMKKEINRLNMEIQQYQAENLSLKKELQKSPKLNNDLNDLKDHLKDLMDSSDDTLTNKNIEIFKLQDTLKDKDNQIQILSNNFNNQSQGFKEERKLLSYSVETLNIENHRMKSELGLKTKQIDALKNKFDEYLSNTIKTKGKKSKKDAAFEEILNSKENEISNLKGFTEALKTSLKETSDKLKESTDNLKYKEAENTLLRGKFLQVSEFCNGLVTEGATDEVTNVSNSNYSKIANFCKSVAESKLTYAKGN